MNNYERSKRENGKKMKTVKNQAYLKYKQSNQNVTTLIEIGL